MQEKWIVLWKTGGDNVDPYESHREAFFSEVEAEQKFNELTNATGFPTVWNVELLRVLKES